MRKDKNNKIIHTRDDFAKFLYENVGLINTKEQAEDLTRLIIYFFQSKLKDGDIIEIKGLGVFEKILAEPRTFNVPKITKKRVRIDGKLQLIEELSFKEIKKDTEFKVLFRPSQTIKNLLNSKNNEENN